MKLILGFLLLVGSLAAQSPVPEPDVDASPFEPSAQDFFDPQHKYAQPQVVRAIDVYWPSELMSAPGAADVTLLVRIDGSGRPIKIRVLTSPGPLFSRECIKGVRGARWVGVGREVAFYCRFAMSYSIGQPERPKFTFPPQSPEPKPLAVDEGEKKRPNQSPEPTVMSVTPRADARVAPATTVAHL